MLSISGPETGWEVELRFRIEMTENWNRGQNGAFMDSKISGPQWGAFRLVRRIFGHGSLSQLRTHMTRLNDRTVQRAGSSSQNLFQQKPKSNGGSSHRKYLYFPVTIKAEEHFSVLD